MMIKSMPTDLLLCTVFLTCVHVVLSVVHPDGVSQVTHYQDELGNYKFGYTVSSVDGEHFHRSDKDVEGRIVGSYGLTESDGRQRVVDYVADHAGFRARVRSNEPGLAGGQSAAVSIEKSGPVIIGNPPLDFAATDEDHSVTSFFRSNEAERDPESERRISHSKYSASSQDSKDTDIQSNPVASDAGPERKIAHLNYAASDTGNAALDYAASDPSSSRLAKYGQRIKETTSRVEYARPFEEEQYRRRLPISSSRNNGDRNDQSKIEDAPWHSPLSSRRRTSQNRNSDVYGPKIEVEDTLIGDGLGPVYRPPLDPFNARRPLITSRATSIARPLPIFTPQPSTPPYGGFENRNPFSVSSDNPISGPYPFPRSYRTDDGVNPAVSLFNIHGGLGNMFPLLPPPPPPGIVRDPTVGLAPPELVLRELMSLDGKRVPGHPDLVFRVITAQNGIQVVPIDPLTGQTRNVPLLPLYDPLNGEQRAILDRDRNYEFKFDNFDGPTSRRPFRPFEREPGSAEGTTRSSFDSNNVNRDRSLPGTFRRRPTFLGPRPGSDEFEGSRTNFDDDFPLPSRFGPPSPPPRTIKGTRYDLLGPPINSRGYRSAENNDGDDSRDAEDDGQASEEVRASTPTT